MRIAILHFMAVALVSLVLAAATTPDGVYDDARYLAAAPLRNVGYALTLPLSEVSAAFTMTESLFFLPVEVRTLIIVFLFAANSLLWGVAADGYFKLVQNLRRRLVKRP